MKNPITWQYKVGGGGGLMDTELMDLLHRNTRSPTFHQIALLNDEIYDNRKYAPLKCEIIYFTLSLTDTGQVGWKKILPTYHTLFACGGTHFLGPALTNFPIKKKLLYIGAYLTFTDFQLRISKVSQETFWDKLFFRTISKQVIREHK